MTYTVVIEKAGENFSAHVPDLPGCVATGATIEATMEAMRGAVAMHLDGLREDGEEIPPATTVALTVNVAA